MEHIEIVENGLFLVFEIADDKCFKFLHFGKKPFNEKDIIARSTSYGFRPVHSGLSLPPQRSAYNIRILPHLCRHWRYRN